jgi:hypothetical protein
MTNQVTVTQPTGIVPFDYGDMAGNGLDLLTPGEDSFPFIRVLQALSPVVAEGKNPAAKAGMFYNSLSDELFDGDAGIIIVPCGFEHDFQIWRTLENGGGLVEKRKLDDADCLKAISNFLTARKINPKLKGPILLGEHTIVETKTIVGVQLDPDLSVIQPIGGCLFSAKSSMLPVVRNWQRTLNRKLPKGAPVYNRAYRFSSVREKNDAGQTWLNLRISNPVGMEMDATANIIAHRPGGRELMLECQKVYKAIVSGALKVKADEDNTPHKEAEVEVPF